jgi:hypothetical protein
MKNWLKSGQNSRKLVKKNSLMENGLKTLSKTVKTGQKSLKLVKNGPN